MYPRRNLHIISLPRWDEEFLARTAVLQALFRVALPINAEIRLINTRAQDTAAFLDARRFVLWAVKEGLVPEEFTKECLRYARG